MNLNLVNYFRFGNVIDKPSGIEYQLESIQDLKSTMRNEFAWKLNNWILRHFKNVCTDLFYLKRWNFRNVDMIKPDIQPECLDNNLLTARKMLRIFIIDHIFTLKTSCTLYTMCWLCLIWFTESHFDSTTREAKSGQPSIVQSMFTYSLTLSLNLFSNALKEELSHSKINHLQKCPK